MERQLFGGGMGYGGYPGYGMGYGGYPGYGMSYGGCSGHVWVTEVILVTAWVMEVILVTVWVMEVILTTIIMDIITGTDDVKLQHRYNPGDISSGFLIFCIGGHLVFPLTNKIKNI